MRFVRGLSPSAALVHSCDEHCSVRAASNLNVADEAGCECHWRRPGDAVVRMCHEKSIPDGKIISTRCTCGPVEGAAGLLSTHIDCRSSLVS